MEIAHLVPAGVASYTFFKFVTNPQGKINKKLPRVKLKTFELSPEIRINIGKRSIHMHHWVNLSILLAISIPATGALFDSSIMKALMVGGILQGLTYPDAKQIIKFKNN